MPQALIDCYRLSNILGIESYDLLKASHREWIEESLGIGNNGRESKWTQTITVGSKGFIEKTKAELGIRAKGRRISKYDEAYELQEPPAPYGEDFDVENGGLRLQNTYLWSIFPDI